jgi:hypothetical protein
MNRHLFGLLVLVGCLALATIIWWLPGLSAQASPAHSPCPDPSATDANRGRIEALERSIEQVARALRASGMCETPGMGEAK